MMQRDTLLIGDQRVLTFKIQIMEGEQFLFPTPKNPVIEGVEIIGEPVTDTLSIREGIVELENRITITSFDSGSYRLPLLPAYRIRHTGETDTLWFDGGSLEVTTIQIDTATYKPFDVKSQLNYPFTIKETLPWAGFILLFVAISYVIYRYIKNRREHKDIFGRTIVQDPPHIVALRKLEHIRNQKLWLKDQKQFFTDVTDVLREYIEKRYLIATMERTSGEILAELSRVDMESKIYLELKELMRTSDLVKFAKYRADEQECERTIPAAVRFVNATFLQEIEENDG